MKKSAKALLYAAGIGTAVTAAVAESLYYFALTGKGNRKVKPLMNKMGKQFEYSGNDPEADEILKNKKLFCEQVREWYAGVVKESVSTVNCLADDCYAKIVRQPEDSHLWLIAIHGFSSNVDSMAKYSMSYYEHGFNVLLPHMRGHEGSGSDKITMGWLDRYDIVAWIYYILELDPDAQIVLHGESMGAATVMMTVGEPLPDNVVCAVEDCGFTSLWDEYSTQITGLLKLPAFPFLYAADAITRVRSGFNFKEASCVKQLRNSKTPMLFIHGEADNFIPFEMVYENYNAFDGEKDILTIPGAGHAEAILIDHETYLKKLWEFVGKYVVLTAPAAEEKNA